jgi:hypothetical protein
VFIVWALPRLTLGQGFFETHGRHHGRSTSQAQPGHEQPGALALNGNANAWTASSIPSVTLGDNFAAWRSWRLARSVECIGPAGRFFWKGRPRRERAAHGAVGTNVADLTTSRPAWQWGELLTGKSKKAPSLHPAPVTLTALSPAGTAARPSRTYFGAPETRDNISRMVNQSSQEQSRSKPRRPAKCDRSSADLAHHLGPFVFLAEDGELRVGRCEACGNAVFRQKTGKPKS